MYCDLLRASLVWVLLSFDVKIRYHKIAMIAAETMKPREHFLELDFVLQALLPARIVWKVPFV